MYVITGATGHTGSVAARTLLSRGQKVRAIGRTPDRLQPLTSAGAEPFVADVTDAKRLSEAFRGAQAVYAMIPPNIQSNDVRGYQEQVSDVISSAIANAKVPFVVLLSSIGADKPDKTGPVVGLHNFEQKLNRIDGTNVLHLRAGYFMENTLAQVNAIKAVGKSAGPLRPDHRHAGHRNRNCRIPSSPQVSGQANPRTARPARLEYDRSCGCHRQCHRQT